MNRVLTLKKISVLLKLQISVPVALSALTGFVLHRGAVGNEGVLVALAVFLMSGAAATVNHIQERDTDRLMPRTQHRPLAAGTVGVNTAGWLATMLAASGTLLLALFFHPLALLLSWVAVVWYNLVYTPLKRITAFAVLPGALTGALPPVIGFAASGGVPPTLEIFTIALFFLVGQIPHFWLLLSIYGDQYALAGLPTPRRYFSSQQMKRVTLAWVIATLATAAFTTEMIVACPALKITMAIYITLLSGATFAWFFRPQYIRPELLFRLLNLLYLLMMTMLITEGLIRR